MAFRKKSTSTEIQLDLEVDNGDLEALKQVIAKYHFTGEEAALRFALIVLLNTENNNVYIDKNGQVVKITPNPSLIDNNGTDS